MKIQIWVHKNEAISGNITHHHYTRPYLDRNEEWVQVTISQNEFAKLHDNTIPDSAIDNQELRDTIEDGGGWLVKQYNRNRDQKDWVNNIEEIPYIYEKNPDNNEVYRRKTGDPIENRERVSMGVSERDYSADKGLEQLEKEMKTKTGSEFMTWFHKLTKNEQTTLTKYYND